MSVTVHLARPLHIVDSGARGPTRERIIAEVTLREPTGRDLRLFDRHQGQPVELARALIEALTGLTKMQVGRLATIDVEALSRAVRAASAPGSVVIEQTAKLSHYVSVRPT